MEDLYGRILFEDYVLVDGELLCRATGKVIKDKPIEDLNLSVRAYNVLIREGLHNISDFIGINTVTLMNFRNMGVGTVNELLLKLKQFEEGDFGEDETATDDVIIAFKWHNKIAWDISFDSVPLSVRSRNRMDVMQVKYARQFLALENVSNISGLGQKSINELVELKKQFICNSIRGTEEERQYILELFMGAKTKLQCLYTARNEEYLDSAILGSIFDLRADERSLQSLLLSMKALPVFKELIEKKVTAIIKESLFDGVTIVQIAQAIGFDGDDVAIKNAIDQTILNGAAYKEYDKFYFIYPSIMDAINVLTSKEAEIMARRLNGETLEAIAGVYDFTKERIRQIIEKSYEKLFVKNKHADIIDNVKEDKYKYFFETYSLEQDDFCEMTSEAEYVWNYLTVRYDNGADELSKALSDEKLPLHLRYGIQRFLNKDFLVIGNQRIPLNRFALKEYVLSTYCLEETYFDEFIKLYNDFLEEHKLADNKKLQLEGNYRALENSLLRSRKILWKQNRRLRYYNIDEMDFSELLQTLNLKRYRNIELSAEKFFKDYSELMKSYDLRDEYELHNLLRKVYSEDEYINFSRNPTIRFGEFSRAKAVFDAICLLSPISSDDLAAFLSEEYGFKPEFIKSNWLPEVNLYYNNGIFSVKNDELPKEDFHALRSALTEDFYFIDDVREVYKSVAKSYDEALLSAYNFKRLGFTPYCNYIVRSTMTAEAYFRRCLTTDDVINLSEISSRFSGMGTYYACLMELKDTCEIIEFEPDKYVNVRRIKRQGVTDANIDGFRNEVFDSVHANEYFTLKMLFDGGIVKKFSALDYGDLFYASLLRGDNRFSFRRMKNGVVFIKGDIKFSRKDFFEYIFEKKDNLSVTELQNYIENYYGISIPREDIFKTVSDSTLLNYDPITGMISCLLTCK